MQTVFNMMLDVSRFHSVKHRTDISKQMGNVSRLNKTDKKIKITRQVNKIYERET